MKPDKLYTELKTLAEKLGIKVLEQNFRNVGIHVKSGYCVVKNEDHCFIDKHIKLRKKVEVLSECLSLFPHENIYVLPSVREHLELYAPKEKPPEKGESESSGT